MADRDDIGIPIWPGEAREPQPPQRFEPAEWSHRCIAKNERNVFLALGTGCRACGARERR